jgi:hypothetical protein
MLPPSHHHHPGHQPAAHHHGTDAPLYTEPRKYGLTRSVRDPRITGAVAIVVFALVVLLLVTFV